MVQRELEPVSLPLGPRPDPSLFCSPPQTNHAGSGSNSKQSGCFPSNWCGAGEDDAFDEAEAKDKARRKKLADQQQQQQNLQPKPTLPMSRPSDATTAVESGSVTHKTGDVSPKGELGPVVEGGPVDGGLASSPVVQQLPRSDAGEGITREELEARKNAAGDVVTGP